MLPEVGAMTVTVYVALAPPARSTAAQRTTPLLKVVLPEAPEKAAPAGKLSAATTFVAVDGPLFVTVRV
jgi:hypothetical protein